MKANAEYVQEYIAKRDRGASTGHRALQKANELAGSVGLVPVALEAGMQLGETLLVSGQTQNAVDVLGRVGQIAQALKIPSRSAPQPHCLVKPMHRSRTSRQQCSLASERSSSRAT